jgi:hypothetical protein
MGPHLAIMHVRADECEHQVQRELGRQLLLTAEGLPCPAWTTPRLHDVAAALANLATTPRRAARPLSRLVGVLVVLLLLGVRVLGPESPRAAAWESDAGSGGSVPSTDSAGCMTGRELFTLLTGRDNPAVPPAAPWCAAHC